MTRRREHVKYTQVWRVDSVCAADQPGAARTHAGPGRSWRTRAPVLLDVPARVVTAAGLAIDAYVHADLADTYAKTGGTVNEGVLFRAKSALASLAALAVLIAGRRVVNLPAFAVAASAPAVMLAARYASSLGPLEYLGDPVWYPEKLLAAYAECAAAAAALAGFFLHHGRARATPEKAHRAA